MSLTINLFKCLRCQISLPGDFFGIKINHKNHNLFIQLTVFAITYGLAPEGKSMLFSVHCQFDWNVFICHTAHCVDKISRWHLPDLSWCRTLTSLFSISFWLSRIEILNLEQLIPFLAFIHWCDKSVSIENVRNLAHLLVNQLQ